MVGGGQPGRNRSSTKECPVEGRFDRPAGVSPRQPRAENRSDPCYLVGFAAPVCMAFRLVYTGLRVRDIGRSLKFYTEILGMEVVEHLESFEPTRGKAVILRSPGSSQLLELNWYEEGSRFGTAYVNGEELDHLASKSRTSNMRSRDWRRRVSKSS